MRSPGSPPQVRRSTRSGQQAEIASLWRRNDKLEERLHTHKQALEIQGKASELVTRLLTESAEETTQQPPGPKR